MPTIAELRRQRDTEVLVTLTSGETLLGWLLSVTRRTLWLVVDDADCFPALVNVADVQRSFATAGAVGA